MVIPVFGILAMVFFSVSFSSKSTKPLSLSGDRIAVFVDESASLDIDDLDESNQQQFTTLSGTEVPNFGFNRANIWLKFTLDPKQLQDENYILEIRNPVLDVVDIYEYHTTEFRQIGETGDLLPFASREIEHRNFRIPIWLSGKDEKTFFIKINSGGEQLYAPLQLWTPEQLEDADLKDHLLLGTYFGIIVFVLLFNLFIYLILKEKSNLYYVQYNLNLLLLQLGLTGYAFQFVWPNSPYLANITNPFFASTAVFALLKFSQYFLELKTTFPKVDRIFSIVGWIILGNALLSIFNVQPLLYISIVGVNVMTLLLNMAIIPVTIAVLRKGFKPAKFFLTAFLLLVLTVFGFVLTNLGVIQNEFFASYGLLIGSAFEVILLSFAIVDRFKNFKDQALANLEALNKVEREQNVVLEKKVEERTLELTTKQQEILSSIRYAQRIQRNMLPSENDVRISFPESFVLYQPKDIISGDFYWIDETETTIRVAVGDCTGHGVPGAMMSILAINMVKEAHSKMPLGLPHQVLELMDVLLAEALRSGEYNYASDGMDIIIAHIEKKTHQLQFAGAHNGLIIWRNNEAIELKGTRRPLGLTDQMAKTPFETTTMQLQSGDQLFAFTDGIPDQFGGEQMKKLKQKGLLNWFAENSQLSMTDQREAYYQAFERWKNGTEQIDDVCLVGIKYP